MNIRRLIKKLAAILMTMLLLIPAAYADSLDDVVVISAPLIRSSVVKNGMVRVFLSSIGSVSNLNVTVTGRYSVNGNTALTLTDGDSVAIGFNKSTGDITMTMDGVTYAMGREMRLRRHQANGESAVSIAQASRPNNLYPGDLQLLAVKKSDGTYQMYPIVHVYLEYYLMGVVPYEMSSSWPLEALKAQAVAARTYTVRKMNARTAYTYDVVDTASDQVYFGYTGSSSNATRAVEETKGIVIMNDGSLSGTYYTASNGGQTEAVKNAWGGSSYPYLKVKDDPFDAQNASSIRRKLTIYRDFDHTSQNDALSEILSTAIQAELGDNAVIESINSVTPHTPKYAAPSRLYTLMDFNVTALVDYTYHDVTLTFSIFNDLEDDLGMNINKGTSNELWSVETITDGFKLTVARWGHGIGMSQRGAQKMSQMSYTYDQILGFYYEGCERVQYTFTHTILSAGSSSEVVSTVAPATIAPAELNQATVVLAGVNDTAALRYTANSDGKILTGVPNGAAVTVLAKGTNWSLVRYGEINGYLPTTQLIFNGTPPTSSSQSATLITIWATVTGTNSLNFRSGPGYGYDVLTTLSRGTVLCVLRAEGEWLRVQWGSQAGYVSADYLTTHNTYPGTTSGDSIAMVSLDDVNSTAPLRATASTTGTVLMQLTHGTQVTVLSNDGSWCRVEVAGVTGYLLTTQLDFDAEGVVPTDVPGVQGIPAIVNSTASTLNLRAGPSTEYEVIAQIPKGTVIIVTRYGDAWCAVRWGELSGYVMTRYLLFEDDATPTPTPTATPTPTPTPSPTPSPTPNANIAWVMGTVSYVNLRETPSTSGKIITTIPSGDELTVISQLGTFTYVQHGQAKGYVLSKYLTYTKPLPSIGIMYVNTDVDPLALRNAPTTSGSTVIIRMPRGSAVMLLEELGDWCYVQYGSYVGYCAAAYMSYTKPTEYDRDVTPIYDPTLTEVTGWIAIVNTADGGSLPVYKWCSAEAGRFTTVPNGKTVMVHSKGDIWCEISYGGISGYCLTRDLTLYAP